MMEPLIEVSGLKTHFFLDDGVVKAVNGVDFAIGRGESLGVVGESGCGKTTTGRAILHLIKPTSGRVVFMGRDLGVVMRDKAVQRQISQELQIIFQDPYSSLNPRLTIQQTLCEPMYVHGIGATKADRIKRAEALLDEVDLPIKYLRRYPHEFSGGQRQRICIARTLAVEPRFIICDESVSALDVSVQAQVLNLLKELQLKRNLTYIFISHDLSVVKFMSDLMCVMKDGQIVEHGPAEEVYRAPSHTYTRQLIDAIPKDDLNSIKLRQRQRRAAVPTSQ